jgi:large subunit ribosomal protein L5
MNRLQKNYQQKIVQELQQELGLKHPMAVPRLSKIVVATSFFETEHQDEAIKKAASWMAKACGQQPGVTKARQSIAGFSIRAGNELGLKATLRGVRMWDFLDKLLNIVLPRVKDFQGLPRHSFDSGGNYTIGLTEQIIFPEVDYDSADKIRGLQVTIVTTADNTKADESLLEKLGLPFEKQGDKKNGQN